MVLCSRGITVLFCFFISAFVLAREPETLLTVTGSALESINNNTKKYIFSESDFLVLPQHVVKTSTSWTAESEFVGPLLSDVLSKVGASGTEIEIYCIDDYSYTVSIAEARRYGAILAHTMNGKRLQVSDFGPIFLVYPRDQYPAVLRTPVAEAKFAWQIRELLVK